MPRPRNFLKDYYHQGVSSHGESSKVTKSTEQTNSRYSKDDSWLQHLATEKALDQLKHELLQLKATVEKNEDELQHLSGDQNKIVAQRDELMNMVKQKEALMLKDELDKFQKALKFPEDGLFDIDPLKENLENSDEFLKKLKHKGVNTQELEESLQLIKTDKEEIEKLISYRNQIEEFKQEYNISSLKNKEISLNETYTEENYKSAKDDLLKINQLFRNEILKLKQGQQNNFEQILKENEANCLYLSYKIHEYKINSAYSKLKYLAIKAQGSMKDKISKNNIYQSINDLDENINRTLETIIGPKQGKKQKQATRIKQAERVLQKQLEESEEKIQAIQHKNSNLKKKLDQLEGPINIYGRYYPKGYKAKFKKFIDDLAEIYSQEGIKGVKNALSPSTQATDTRSNH
jgi:hypothetical protein